MRKLLQFSLLFCFLFSLNTAVAQENIGIASYYSDSYHGRRTASGELYNKTKLTAAHKTYAFGTYLKVTRLDNKQSITVKVNDRGPYIKGRIVDLSRKAAEALDIVQDGHASVKIEVVPAPASAASSSVNIEAPDANPTPVAAPKPVEEKPAVVASVPKPAETIAKPKPAPAPAPKKEVKDPKTVSAAFAPGEKIVRGESYKDFDLYKVQIMRPVRTGYGVQVASLSNYQNVMKQVAELQEKWFKNILISVEKGKDGKPIYKTILGPFPDRKTAVSYQSQLKKKKKINGFIVDLTTIEYPK